MSTNNSNKSVSKEDKEFGERLYKIIPDGNREEFAGNIGVKYETVRIWCKGKNLPNGSQLVKINEKYNIDIHWLLTGKQFENENVDLKEHTELIELKEEQMSILKKYTEALEDNNRIKKEILKLKQVKREDDPKDFKIPERSICKIAN